MNTQKPPEDIISALNKSFRAINNKLIEAHAMRWEHDQLQQKLLGTGIFCELGVYGRMREDMQPSGTLKRVLQLDYWPELHGRKPFQK